MTYGARTQLRPPDLSANGRIWIIPTPFPTTGLATMFMPLNLQISSRTKTTTTMMELVMVLAPLPDLECDSQN